MPAFIEDISQISIYLTNEKNSTEKIHEVVLLKPFAKQACPISNQKQKRESSFSTKMLLKIENFFFQTFPIFIKEERKSREAKFKTVLALLLSQEHLADFFLKDEEKRKSFFAALLKAAKIYGYKEFSLPPNHLTLKEMGQFLTTIGSQKISLLENKEEFHLQIASLDKNERDEILFSILNHIDRPPSLSVVEVEKGDTIEKLKLTTIYGKYKVLKIDDKKIDDKKIEYQRVENQSSPSFRVSREKVLINQHKVFDCSYKENRFLVGVSGELLHHYRVLEQILFLLEVKGECFIEKYPPIALQEKVIFFTSLFSWNEYEKIMDEHFAIEKWHGKTLKIVEETGKISYFRLNLHHQNIPFNAFNKFPTPSEIKGVINDINDKALIFLIDKMLDFYPLKHLAHQFDEIRSETDFLRKENGLNDCVDKFRLMKKDLLAFIDAAKPSFALLALKTLLSKKLRSRNVLHAIDMFHYLSLIIENLGFLHTVNCVDGTDRSASAISIIKAQNAYQHTTQKPYLPGFSNEQETSLFKVFYSMYLLFEEPELNAGLTTGFIAEKNHIQKNLEATFYIIPWLKKHREIYLSYRK